MLQSRKFKELRKQEGYPKKIATLGDYLKATRLERGLKQEEVALLLGTTATSVLDWEKNHHQPSVTKIKSIVHFLGFNPMSSDNSERTFGERLRVSRISIGISQKILARQLGIDPGTLGSFELDKKLPETELRKNITHLIGIEF